MSDRNRRLILASRPVGIDPVDASTWRVVEADVPEPNNGEVLVRNIFISVDPAMRGWIRPTPTYVPPVEVSGVMRAGTVGQIVASRNENFCTGDFVSDVAGNLGFQDYALSNGRGLLKIDPNKAPLSAYVGGLGLNGFTAYFGLLEVGRPVPGDTVVVSSAAGATGSIAGQIARIKGNRVIGVAGGQEKCRLVGDTFRFDGVIDYKASPKVTDAIASACPGGVDVFFDNVGGSLLDAVLLRLNQNGRVVISGAISQSASGTECVRAHLRLAMVHGRMEGFIAYEYADRFSSALEELVGWYSSGSLRSMEEVVQGFDSLPQCLNRVFEGRHNGKMVIQIAPFA